MFHKNLLTFVTAAWLCTTIGLLFALGTLEASHELERRAYHYCVQQNQNRVQANDAVSLPNDQKLIAYLSAHPCSKDSSQREWDDLKAQQDMALWARWMLWATSTATFLTGVGLLLIRKTLIYTRDALVEAKKTTAAAQETVAVTDRAAKAQLRAYIGATPEVCTTSNRLVTLQVKLKNYGQTPAFNVTYCGQMLKLEQPVPIDFQWECIPSNTQNVINPGQDVDIFPSIAHPTQQEVQSMIRNEIGIYVWGKITFIDVYGREQWAKFRFVHSGKNIHLDRSFAYCPTGNDASRE